MSRLPPRPSSKVKTSPLLRSMIGNRHRCGTDPLSLHFSNALGRTPSSRANLASNFQSGTFLGLLIAPLLSDFPSDLQRYFIDHANRLARYLHLLMARNKDFDELVGIRLRVKAAMRSFREGRNWSQAEMAHFLAITEDNYQSYESKPERNIPTEIIARFAKFSGHDISWLMLGIKAASEPAIKVSYPTLVD
ncbi:MAG: helix-turn-helix transcriptional regulator [Acetobacteraceae bacterium]|nr:helix-turn-helix transcriptional regulator [Acetobacteraceae bacterium]